MSRSVLVEIEEKRKVRCSHDPFSRRYFIKFNSVRARGRRTFHDGSAFEVVAVRCLSRSCYYALLRDLRPEAVRKFEAVTTK